MPNQKTDPLRAALGPDLQTGALRAVLILAAFAIVGGTLAWLIH